MSTSNCLANSRFRSSLAFSSPLSLSNKYSSFSNSFFPSWSALISAARVSGAAPRPLRPPRRQAGPIGRTSLQLLELGSQVVDDARHGAARRVHLGPVPHCVHARIAEGTLPLARCHRYGMAGEGHGCGARSPAVPLAPGVRWSGGKGQVCGREGLPASPHTPLFVKNVHGYARALPLPTRRAAGVQRLGLARWSCLPSVCCCAALPASPPRPGARIRRADWPSTSAPRTRAMRRLRRRCQPAPSVPAR